MSGDYDSFFLCHSQVPCSLSLHHTFPLHLSAYTNACFVCAPTGGHFLPHLSQTVAVDLLFDKSYPQQPEHPATAHAKLHSAPPAARPMVIDTSLTHSLHLLHGRPRLNSSCLCLVVSSHTDLLSGFVCVLIRRANMVVVAGNSADQTITAATHIWRAVQRVGSSRVSRQARPMLGTSCMSVSHTSHSKREKRLH